MNLKEIAEEINKNHKIAVSAHVHPDGDALGSTFALAYGLKRLGKEVQIYLEDKIPETYKNFFSEDLVKHEIDEQKYDLFISLDVSTEDRLGICAELKNKSSKTMNIDHHISNLGIADYNYLEADASATAEIIYQLLEILNIEFDKNIITYLYIGIVTDTGGFQYSNTTPKTMLIASKLLEYDIEASKIFREIFEVISKRKMEILKISLQNLKLYENGKIGMIVLTQNDLQKIQGTYEDTDGIVNYARNIEGVEVGVLIIEREKNTYKISLRSNDYVNVADISIIFNGGGHERAAGATIISENVDDVQDIIIKEIKKKI